MKRGDKIKIQRFLGSCGAESRAGAGVVDVGGSVVGVGVATGVEVDGGVVVEGVCGLGVSGMAEGVSPGVGDVGGKLGMTEVTYTLPEPL